MAPKGLSRRPLARKCGFRDEAETQRTINFLLSELVKLQERNDLLRQDIQQAHDRISEIEAATNRLRGGA